MDASREVVQTAQQFLRGGCVPLRAFQTIVLVLPLFAAKLQGRQAGLQLRQRDHACLIGVQEPLPLLLGRVQVTLDGDPLGG